MVNTRAEAEAAVRACRYYPLGNRSNAGVRGEWGEFKTYRDYMDAVTVVGATTMIFSIIVILTDGLTR